MYIVDGIAYAGDSTPAVRVSGVRPLENYRLWIRFNTGEARIFDFSPLLTSEAFAPLCDKEVFRQVYIDYGTAVWNDGDIDIAPETLYADSIAADETASA